ncbi:MAG: hypothetical protein ACR2OU_18060 [Thermomicrobiales bacterium]
MHSDSIHELAKLVREGSINRRSFLQCAMTIGLSASAAMMMADSALAQSASPAASPEASPAASPVDGLVTRSITRTE